MKFRDYFSFKQIVFALVIVAMFIGFALWDSVTQVKLTFEDTSVTVKCDKYSMNIPYDMVESAELAQLAEAGEELADGADDETMRSGHWKNDTWGEYFACVDLEATDCILVHLNDGRLFVFSRRDNEATAEDFATLQTYLNP